MSTMKIPKKSTIIVVAFVALRPWPLPPPSIAHYTGSADAEP